MTTHPKAEVNIMTKEFAGAKSVAISAATLSILTMTLMCFGASDGAHAQQKSIKERLIGTWTLVASENVGADGSKIDEYGPNPKGVLMFDSNGRYSVTIMRADLPKFAANKADQGSAVENQAVVAGLVTHFGTYSVNEAEKLLTSHIEASSFPNNNGVDQRRGIVSLTADELRYGLPVTVTGTKAEVLWKRAK
jgi:Lipocalin-like domain